MRRQRRQWPRHWSPELGEGLQWGQNSLQGLLIRGRPIKRATILLVVALAWLWTWLWTGTLPRLAQLERELKLNSGHDIDLMIWAGGAINHTEGAHGPNDQKDDATALSTGRNGEGKQAEQAADQLPAMIQPTVSAMLPSNDQALPAIPHAFVFTYKHDVLATKDPSELYDNIQHTIDRYREAWDSPGAKIWFLNDASCRAAINATEPGLVQHFDREKQGMYKADICRVAVLFLEGGYYFDVDLRVVEPLRLSNETQFATVSSPHGTAFFQAFMASAPRHPILREALRIMLAYYEAKHKIPGRMVGPSTLKDAYDAVDPSDRGVVRLLRENFLEDNMYPDLPRQQGEGRGCKYFVHDPAARVVYFFSRIPGRTSRACKLLPRDNQTN